MTSQFPVWVGNGARSSANAGRLSPHTCPGMSCTLGSWCFGTASRRAVARGSGFGVWSLWRDATFGHRCFDCVGNLTGSGGSSSGPRDEVGGFGTTRVNETILGQALTHVDGPCHHPKTGRRAGGNERSCGGGGAHVVDDGCSVTTVASIKRYFSCSWRSLRSEVILAV